MILHCMHKAAWETRGKLETWGEEAIAADGFIHCSTVELFWRVAPNFENAEDALVLLCIDEDRLTAQVRYEDVDGLGRLYPHVYGPINNSAVGCVLPFLRDSLGRYVKNPEFSTIEDR